MRPITHKGRVAAFAEGDRVMFAEHIDVLEAEHPVRRFVSAMCLFSCELDAAPRPRARYRDQAAEAYARTLLMETELFDALDRVLEDHLLAEEFNVPLEQVELRREDLIAHDAVGG